MEQIILGILAGAAVLVIEAEGRYIDWLLGKDCWGDAPYVSIIQVLDAKCFLDSLESRALAA